jgi:hypothetical protein
MSDDAMSTSNQLLSPHLCQFTPLFGLLLGKSSALCNQFGGKLVLFGEIIPQAE